MGETGIETWGDGSKFQDLCADLLDREGYRVERTKGVGPGGPGDIIASQPLALGNDESAEFKWLVECKARSGSNAVVYPDDLPNIENAVARHDCDGFFLATNARLSSGVEETLTKIGGGDGIRTTYWDRRLVVQKLNSWRDVQAKYGLGASMDGSRASNRPANLFKFLDSYQESDSPIFYGREDEIGFITGAVYRYSLTLISGESGAGKSSLLYAGLFPTLRREGTLIAAVRCLDSPVNRIRSEVIRQLKAGLDLKAVEVKRLTDSESLAALLKESADLLEQHSTQLRIIVDQFEELFTLCGKSEAEQIAYALTQAGDGTMTRGKLGFVLCLREDFLGALRRWARATGADPIFNWDAIYALDKLKRRQAEQVIINTFERGRIDISSALAATISKDLAAIQEPVYPPHLQIVCGTLAEESLAEGKKGKARASPAKYKNLGGAEKIIADYFQANLWKGFDEQEVSLAKRILRSLTGPDGLKEPRTAREVAAEVRQRASSVQPILDALVKQRMIRRVVGVDDDKPREIAYELIHDFFGRMLYADMSEEEQEERRAIATWRAALRDWDSYGVVPQDEKLEILARHKDALPMSARGIELIIASCSGPELLEWTDFLGNRALEPLIESGLSTGYFYGTESLRSYGQAAFAALKRHFNRTTELERQRRVVGLTADLRTEPAAHYLLQMAKSEPQLGSTVLSALQKMEELGSRALLSEFKSREAIDFLCDNLANYFWYWRDWIDPILSLDVPYAVKKLRKRLIDATEVSGDLIELTADFGGIEVFPLLEAHYDTAPLRVKTATIDAIGNHGKPQHAKILVRWMNGDQRPTLHRAAAKALGKIADRRAILPLNRMLNQTSTFAAGHIHKAIQAIESRSKTSRLAS